MTVSSRTFAAVVEALDVAGMLTVPGDAGPSIKDIRRLCEALDAAGFQRVMPVRYTSDPATGRAVAHAERTAWCDRPKCRIDSPHVHIDHPSSLERNAAMMQAEVAAALPDEPEWACPLCYELRPHDHSTDPGKPGIVFRA